MRIQEIISEINFSLYTAMHIHNSFRPDHGSFNGENHQKLLDSMKNFHVNVNGWSDIGYHIVIFPDGKVLKGRDFNRTPASIKGANTGAFAVLALGNFDEGHDELKGPQKEALVEISRAFDDGGIKVMFHREGPNATKTCPGTSIDKEKFMEVVRQGNDYENHWAKEEIEKMMEYGIFNKTDEFRPKDNITRAEMAVVADRIMEYIVNN